MGWPYTHEQDAGTEPVHTYSQGASDGVGESACNATGLIAPHCYKEEYCFVVACVGLNARLTGITHTSRLPVTTADVGASEVYI